MTRSTLGSVGRLLLVTSLVVGGPLAAQAPSPILVLQPGMATEDFVSARDAASRTGFLIRFVTRVPTRSRWWTLVVGASTTPQGTGSGPERRDNAPMLFAGNAFPLLRPERTHGWLGLEAPVLLTYTMGGGRERNTREYGQDVALDIASEIYIGRKIFGEFGSVLSRLRVYGILHQTLTPNRDANGRRDRFRPLAFYGLTIPLGDRRSGA